MDTTKVPKNMNIGCNFPNSFCVATTSLYISSIHPLPLSMKRENALLCTSIKIKKKNYAQVLLLEKTQF